MRKSSLSRSLQSRQRQTKQPDTQTRVAAYVLSLLYLLLALTHPQLTNAATTPGATPGKFEVSPTGAATYTIPLTVPPGTAGMAPTLSLNYNSQSGNGPLGVGWSLGGLSTIHRCPMTVAQDGRKNGINYDRGDRYCLDGQRLVVVAGTYGADGAEYRTETESYTRVISYGSAGNGPASFKAWTKSGQIIEYGNTEDSRIEAQGKATVRLWNVNKISDTKGNYIATSYTEDNANGEAYVSRIDYTGNAAAGVAPFASVRFGYEVRPDVENGYEVGSIIKTGKRIANIQTYNTTALVKSYKLIYAQSLSSQRSYISKVTECVADGTCLPSTTIQWPLQSPGFASATNASIQTWDNPNVRNIAGDFNGDGKTDFLVWHAPFNNYRYNLYLSNGNGFDSAIPTDVQSWDNYKLNNQVVGDFNGDGKTDLLMWHVPFNNYRFNLYISTGNGFAPAVATNIQTWDNPSIRNIAGDFNGDGKTDFLVWHAPFNNYRYNLYLSNGNGFADALPTNVQSWDNYKLDNQVAGDFNGDGKIDLLMWHVPFNNYRFNLYLSTGNGFAPAAATNIETWDNSNVRNSLGDFNGDGKSDFLVWHAPFNNYRFNAYLNISGNTDTITSVTNALGNIAAFAYKPLTDVSVYTKDIGK